MSSLAERLRAEGHVEPPKQAPRQGPLWQGPESTDDQGGITFSLLCKFLTCRERFRLYAIEGISVLDGFNPRLEYGNMWHLCEEGHAANKNMDEITEDLTTYCQDLIAKYPFSQQQIEHWYVTCLTQFPIYIDYWRQHPDVQQRTPLLQEEKFKVPYRLPSGRVIILRGKWDSVDIIEGEGIYLQENKTKGSIDEVSLRRQLRFDLQTMIYMTALAHSEQIGSMPHSLRGVRYNVIRRPWSGGKGMIKQSEGTKGTRCTRSSCKIEPSPTCDKCEGFGRVGGTPPETRDQFFDRWVRDYLTTDEDRAAWFMRWKIEVTSSEVEIFRKTCLDAMLEQLAHWYDVVVKGLDVQLPSWALSYRAAYGVYNPLIDTRGSMGGTDIDEYLNNKSMAGLRRIDNLFPEL